MIGAFRSSLLFRLTDDVHSEVSVIFLGFLQHLNNQQPTIRFTMETEKDNSIPFLDTSVIRDSNGLLTTSVYRKPTHTDQYLAYDSHHPQSVKRGIETGRAMQDRIKEHNRDIRLAHTQTSAVSEHVNETGHLPLWNQVKFIDRDPHRYTRRIKEAIQIRLHSNNINRDSGMEIPEAWIPTIRKHNSRSTTKRTSEGTSSVSRNNNEDRNAPITANQRA